MKTEYQINSVTTAQISSIDSKSITIARTPTGSGHLIQASDGIYTYWFYADTTRVIQIILYTDTGNITGVPIIIDRPYWGDAVRCAALNTNCETFI